MKSLGAHLLRDGVNLTKVSLPVRVFEPRSFLERISDSFAYMHLLEAAAEAEDPVARMQYLVHTDATCLWHTKISCMPCCLLGPTHSSASRVAPMGWLLGMMTASVPALAATGGRLVHIYAVCMSAICRAMACLQGGFSI